MNPPYSTVSQSCASSIHTKDAPSTHTTFSARRSHHSKHSSSHESERTVRRSSRHGRHSDTHTHSSEHTAIKESVIAAFSNSDHTGKSESRDTVVPLPPQPPTETSPTGNGGGRTKIRRRKKHHRNFSRTTSSSSLTLSTQTNTHTTSSRSTSSRSGSSRSSRTRSSSSPPPYSLHAPTSKRSKRTSARIPSRFQPPRMARTLATLDDLGALLFFRLPLYLGRRKTVYVLDDLGIWGVCRPLRKLGLLYERIEERWWTWRDWR